MTQTYKLSRLHTRGGELLPSVETEVAGIRTTLLVDTGSDISSFTPELVARMGLLGQMEPFGHAAGIAETATRVLGVKHDIGVLGKTIKEWLVFTGLVADRTQGLLGMDVLSQFHRFTFDNHKGTLEVEG